MTFLKKGQPQRHVNNNHYHLNRQEFILMMMKLLSGMFACWYDDLCKTNPNYSSACVNIHTLSPLM